LKNESFRLVNKTFSLALVRYLPKNKVAFLWPAIPRPDFLKNTETGMRMRAFQFIDLQVLKKYVIGHLKI
jgi:hypothetical protein